MALSKHEKEIIAEYVRKENLPIVNSRDIEVCPKKSIYTKYIKRCLDIVLSLSGIFVTLPVNIILAVCTFFNFGRPIFFFQTRPGYNGQEFTIIKFRNLTNEVDKNGELLPIEKRVTKFGQFVRRTSLDELLNFVSILKGDMSVVGPRPLAQIYLKRYSERHKKRHLVRPGLECPPLNGKIRRGWQDQFENDIWYVENVCFVVDLRMFFGIIKMLFDKKRRDSHAKYGADEGDFIGYTRDGVAFGESTIPEEYLELIAIRGKK